MKKILIFLIAILTASFSLAQKLPVNSETLSRLDTISDSANYIMTKYRATLLFALLTDPTFPNDLIVTRYGIFLDSIRSDGPALFKDDMTVNGHIFITGTGESIYLGTGAGIVVTTGTQNNLKGYNAGNDLTEGYHNDLDGVRSGEFLTISYGNVFNGSISGRLTSTDSNLVYCYNSVLLGNNTKVKWNNGKKQIVIGSDAIGQGDYTATIGDDEITDVYMSEDAGATTHQGASKLTATDTTGVGSTANIGTMMYYDGHFYGLIAGAPPTWNQLD